MIKLIRMIRMIIIIARCLQSPHVAAHAPDLPHDERLGRLGTCLNVILAYCFLLILLFAVFRWIVFAWANRGLAPTLVYSMQHVVRARVASSRYGQSTY